MDGCALDEWPTAVGPNEPAGWTPDGADTLLGTRLGQFRIDAVIGRGATGIVYRATQLDLARSVAVKVLHGELAADQAMVARFYREARAVARLTHPGVVTVFAVGDCADGRPYIAMELVDGVTLDDALDDGAMTCARAIVIARQIAAALAVTHAAGVVHRDLKPANIMLLGPGHDAVKIVDFGIARSLDEEPRITAGGMVVGTPHYMAPEQASGEPVDGRADLYAAGCVLYHMITGDVPFDGSGVQVMMAHLHRTPPRPCDVVPDLPPALEAVILRCLEKRPADRFATAADLVAALDDLAAAGLAATRGPSLWSTPRTSGPAAAELPRRSSQEVAWAVDSTTTDVWTPPRRRLGGWWAALVIAVVAAAAVRFDAVDRGRAALAALRGTPIASAVDVEAALPGRRSILLSTGDVALRATMPAVIRPGVSAQIDLVLWDADGRPVAAPEAVVTVTDPGGGVRGLGAAAIDAGRYRFHTSFPRRGQYVLNVFVLDGDATLTIPFEVGSPRAGSPALPGSPRPST